MTQHAGAQMSEEAARWRAIGIAHGYALALRALEHRLVDLENSVDVLEAQFAKQERAILWQTIAPKARKTNRTMQRRPATMEMRLYIRRQFAREQARALWEALEALRAKAPSGEDAGGA